jgi:hypothetical protein
MSRISVPPNTKQVADDKLSHAGSAFDWRKHLAVHPAADLFPLLPSEELEELAKDIEANGLRSPIYLWAPKPKDTVELLDGRNRLDALAKLGLLAVDKASPRITPRTVSGSRLQWVPRISRLCISTAAGPAL